MMHIIIGLFFIALGVWGVFDEWYYVVDFIKGSGSVLLILVGAIAIFAGAAGPLRKPEENGDEGDWPAEDELPDQDLADDDAGDDEGDGEDDGEDGGEVKAGGDDEPAGETEDEDRSDG